MQRWCTIAARAAPRRRSGRPPPSRHAWPGPSPCLQREGRGFPWDRVKGEWGRLDRRAPEGSADCVVCGRWPRDWGSGWRILQTCLCHLKPGRRYTLVRLLQNVPSIQKHVRSAESPFAECAKYTKAGVFCRISLLQNVPSIQKRVSSVESKCPSPSIQKQVSSVDLTPRGHDSTLPRAPFVEFDAGVLHDVLSPQLGPRWHFWWHGWFGDTLSGTQPGDFGKVQDEGIGGPRASSGGGDCTTASPSFSPLQPLCSPHQAPIFPVLLRPCPRPASPIDPPGYRIYKACVSNPAACGKSRRRASPALWVATVRLMMAMMMVGMVSQRGARSGGAGPLRRLQKPCQTALGILPRLNVPGGTVADN